MLRTTLFILFIILPGISHALESEEERLRIQTRLDAACEEARQVALAPRKAEIYKECIERFHKSEEKCKEEADGYNGARYKATPLYYDLPACETAFENRRKNRSSD